MDASNIKVGEVFWREVIFSEVEPPKMCELYPKKSDHGGVILRAEPGWGYFAKDDEGWVITSSDRRGLICFCYFTLPKDLSKVVGFRVCRISNAKTSVCVMPVVGTFDELLTHFATPEGCVQYRQA